MFRILVFLLVMAAAAFGIAWLIDRPGDIVVSWQGYRIETSVGVGIAAVFLAAAAIALLWSLLRLAMRAPHLLRRRAAAKRQAKGYAALSRGMIAVGAGDARLARKSAAEAGKHLADDPLALLLAAQAAQLHGDRAAAAASFEKLAKNPETRLLGLRGLHVEAQRRGDHDAALAYAYQAHQVAPLPWSGKAVLEHRAAQGQWEEALAALESHIAARLIDKPTGERQRAVLETAIALDKADRAPDEALHLAKEAIARAPDLVPAAVVAARLMSRKGEIRRAAKLIEQVWQRQRHPELAEAYVDLRPGDSNADRLAKAQALARLAPSDPESRIIVARTALAARDYATARKAMAPLVAEGERPSARMCLVMAELEDAEFGDQGQVRDWLARSARAPRDECWIADGVISKHWAPVSPVTGRLDAFVWQRPAERLGSDFDAPEWTRHWSLPAREASGDQTTAAAEIDPPAQPASPASAVIEAVAEPTPGPTSTAAAEKPKTPEPTPVSISKVQMSGRNPRPSQKVVFPMPGAPDDPGTGEEPEAERIPRIGFM